MFFSSSFNFLWTHCLYLFRYRKFYRALCSVASVCADGFSLAHKCECMLVCAMCICVSVLHLKPAFISFSIKDIVVFRYIHRPNNNVSIKYFSFSISSFYTHMFVVGLTRETFGSLFPNSLLYPRFLFRAVHLLSLFLSLQQYVSVSDIKEWRTPSFFYCCSRVVCMLHHHGVLIFFLLSIFISFYTCKWTLCDGSFSLM